MTQTQTYPYGTIVRRPSVRQFVADDLFVMLLCLAGLTVAGMDDLPLRSLLLWVSLSVAACLAYRFVRLKRTVFYITPEQIIHEHGVLHRTRDYIELYRVVDFREESRLMQQLLGIKTVRVFSGDRTTPSLAMTGMSAGDPLIPSIRERVNHNRRKNGIYEITNR